jgi:hypothetical protein
MEEVSAAVRLVAVSRFSVHKCSDTRNIVSYASLVTCDLQQFKQVKTWEVVLNQRVIQF